MENDSVNEETQTTEVDNKETEGGEDSKETREDRRANHDFLRFKREAKEAKDEVAKLQKQLEQNEARSLEEKQNYKQLWENEKLKNEKLQESNKDLKDTFFTSLKQQEIRKEAARLGIRDEALNDLDLLDTSEVITETTSTGGLNILGAAEFAEKIKSARPHWFGRREAPNINNGNPQYSHGKPLSPADLLKLQKENPAKYREEVLKRLGRK